VGQTGHSGASEGTPPRQRSPVTGCGAEQREPDDRPGIQALAADDWEIIRQVRLRALSDAPYAFTSSYERELAYDEETWRSRATTCRWFAACDGGELVGVAGGVTGWSGDPTVREVVAMWVVPSHRGKGVARSLLDRLAEWARSEGASRLSLGVLEGNESARAAYLSMGMSLTGGTMPAWDDPTRTIEFMECELDARGR
jgi:GNAT superfamily N-acetyltransferase